MYTFFFFACVLVFILDRYLGAEWLGQCVKTRCVGWRVDAVAKSTYGFSRGPNLRFQHPPWLGHNSLLACNSSSREYSVCPLWSPRTIALTCVHLHTDTHIHAYTVRKRPDYVTFPKGLWNLHFYSI